MEQNFAIEMKNISKTFGSLKANDSVELSVRKGEVHALLGENGAGEIDAHEYAVRNIHS